MPSYYFESFSFLWPSFLSQIFIGILREQLLISGYYLFSTLPGKTNKLNNGLLGQCFPLANKVWDAKVQGENQPEGLQGSNWSVVPGQHPNTQ